MRSVVALGLLGAAATVAAHPATQHTGSIRKRVVDLQAFQLKAKAKYVKASVVKTDESVKMIKRADYVAAATELVKKIAPGAEFRVVSDHYVGNNGIAHVNFKQQAHGIDIDNADFNVNIAADGTVFSYGNSFFSGSVPEASPLKKRDFSDPVAALAGATTTLDLPITGQATAEKISDETYSLKGTSGTNSAPEARLVYFAKEDGTLALTWRVETDLVEADNWLLSYVDAGSSNEVHGVVDYVAHATYQVYPWGINDPTELGSRQSLVNPWDPVRSEFTWQGESATVIYNSTRGNNGIAQTNPTGGSSYLNNYRPSSATQNFSYPFDLTLTDPTTYVDASVTQLFYTANTYHDLLHSLGFTEQAGNFETNNNGQGGLGGDNVILNSQDGSGTNNANFATPPDGQLPRMRMYIWTRSTPRRDCCFEAGVVIHEYTHGLSNRLTGGSANSNCLSAAESRGMGEGWSDFYATAIRLKPNDTAAKNYPMGAWVNNDPKGIRAYPYSTSLTTNPYTYKSVGSLSGEHAIGTVWATILYEVLWGLIAVHGKNDAPKPTFGAGGVPTDGKFLAMKLVLDGLALQPCNPNFVQARDAIIDADKALTNGSNACVLWTAFAKRGLGSAAAYNGGSRIESFVIPTGVC